MEANKQLSIVIPTYNRADFLDYSLEVHIPMVKEYNIEISIFDNASTDNTQSIVQKWNKEYEHINYIRHDKNIGAVKNFEYALMYSKKEYIWLVGDTYQIPANAIDYFFNIMNQSNEYYDVIVFNLHDKIKLNSQTYTDFNLVLYDIGALMSCAAISIINKKLLNNDSLNRYLHTSFPHTGLIFEELTKQDKIKIKWLKEYKITGFNNNKLLKTNWSHTPKAFEIGCEDWTNFIMSLPPMYKLEDKMKCIMDFGKVSGLFTFKNLILLRMNGLLNIEIFNKYKKIFPFTINYPLWLIFIISLTPKIIFKMIALFTILLLKKDKKTKIINLFKTKI